MYVILAIIGLSVLVFIHEFGHFFFSKVFKVKVEEFGFGYPPRICGWSKVFPKNKKNKKQIKGFKFFLGRNIPAESSGTIYSLNWIPFGGFNKLKGETGESKDKDSFTNQVWWKKMLIASGGPIANIILAIIIFSISYFVGVPQNIEGNLSQRAHLKQEIGIQLSAIIPNSPAQKSDLKIGDIILNIDGHNFDDVNKIGPYISRNVNQKIKIEVKRGNKILVKEIQVVPYGEISSKELFPDQDDSRGVIGIAFAKTGIVSYPWYQAIFLGIRQTFLLIGQLFCGIWLVLKTLIMKKKMIGQLMGPVGITIFAVRSARVGFVYFLQVIALLSTAIGSFQLIPFPALDGSRIVSSAIEGVRKKRISPAIENVSLTIGFYLLVFLLVWVTFRELINLIK